MHGYVIRKRDRYYAVIYEGLDPITGRERRTWHPAGKDRSVAERLAAHETDGTLPSGDQLGDAITAVDEATGGYPAYYMINCAHPTHFATTLDPEAPWTARIGGIRANASTMSHAELDAATELDGGDPADLAEQYRQLRDPHAHLRVLGGCCGTNHRHIDAIASACVTGVRS